MVDPAPAPPWSAHPEIPRGSIGWRMGIGESYIHAWHDWADGRRREQLVEYFELHRPPLEWADFVADRLFPDVAEKDWEAAVEQLSEELGWVDLAAWRRWNEG